jgi:hypothetical protein
MNKVGKCQAREAEGTTTKGGGMTAQLTEKAVRLVQLSAVLRGWSDVLQSEVAKALRRVSEELWELAD